MNPEKRKSPFRQPASGLFPVSYAGFAGRNSIHYHYDKNLTAFQGGILS